MYILIIKETETHIQGNKPMTIYVVRCLNRGNIAAVTSKKKAKEIVYSEGFEKADLDGEYGHMIKYSKSAFEEIQIDIFN